MTVEKNVVVEGGEEVSTEKKNTCTAVILILQFRSHRKSDALSLVLVLKEIILFYMYIKFNF